ncbi:MAG: hypothetical protein HYV16_11205 [Gammaproteobacteria bacterium]|nr:hypothetical protein [Gammaproteobacteria bacterium]
MGYGKMKAGLVRRLKVGLVLGGAAALAACAGLRGADAEFGHDYPSESVKGNDFVNVTNSFSGRSAWSGSEWKCQPRCEAEAFERLGFRELATAQAGSYRLVIHAEEGMADELGRDFARLGAALWPEWERALSGFFPGAPAAEFHLYAVDEAVPLAMISEEPAGVLVRLRFLMPITRRAPVVAEYAKAIAQLRNVNRQHKETLDAENMVLNSRRFLEWSEKLGNLAHEWSHVVRRWPAPRFGEAEAARRFAFNDEVQAHTLGLWMRHHLSAYTRDGREPLFSELRLGSVDFTTVLGNKDDRYFRRYPEDFLRSFAAGYGSGDESISMAIGSQYLAQLNLANCLNQRVFTTDRPSLERGRRLIAAMLREQPNLLNGYYAPAEACVGEAGEASG